VRKPIQTRLYTFQLCLTHARVCMRTLFLDYTPSCLLATCSVPHIVTAPGPVTQSISSKNAPETSSSETS
jgi:hypothetical protein